MTDEQYVLQKKPKATVKWKQSEQPSCYIDDGFGQILGVTPNDFPARAYPEIIRRPGSRPGKIWRVFVGESL